MRLTLKAINEELASRGVSARLEKGDKYFYFSGGEANDWLDRTVNANNVSDLSLEQWIGEFERLKKLNQEILKAPAVGRPPKLSKPAAKQKDRRR